MTSAKIHKKKLQSMRTREVLLDTAAKCFADNGYAGSSLDMIAQAAGITKGAIYTHFDSKFSLFIAIIHYAFERAVKRTNELKSNGSLVDALIELLCECFHNQEFPIDHKLWAEILAVATRESDVREAFLRCQAELHGIIEKWLQDGMDSGEIEPGLNVKSVTDMLFVLGNGLVVRLAGGDDFDKAFGLLENNIRAFLRPQRS